MKKDGSDVTQASYTHEGGSLYDDLVSMKRGGSTYYYLFDGLGSTRQIVDSNQNTTDTYSYESFGNITSSSGTTTNYYRYVGAYDVEWDAKPSLYFMDARYYSANVGRFLTMDPSTGLPREPLSLHRYVYCRNSPVIFTDAYGLHFHFPKWSWWKNLITCGCCLLSVANVFVVFFVAVQPWTLVLEALDCACTLFTYAVMKPRPPWFGAIVDCLSHLVKDLRGIIEIATQIYHIAVGNIGAPPPWCRKRWERVVYNVFSYECLHACKSLAKW